VFGFRATTPLAAGLEETIAWYIENASSHTTASTH
jgi:dTDP-D-glucose 4,6-dehydratase